jgi:hypothetical protein
LFRIFLGVVAAGLAVTAVIAFVGKNSFSWKLFVGGQPQRLPLGIRWGGTMVSLDEIMDALDEAYPWELAGEEPHGMISRSARNDIRRILCSIELDDDVLSAAASADADLVVCYGPGLVQEPAREPDERFTGSACSIIAVGANADDARGGTADLMADALGLENRRPLVESGRSSIVKVVVFVPEEALERVFEAMATAGAGRIGAYEGCSWRMKGTGTFIPPGGSHPYAGRPGQLTALEETRLEMVCPSYRLSRVLEAMMEKHPYEEVAFDAFMTISPVPWGRGRLGDLPEGKGLGVIARVMSAWCGACEVGIEGDPGMRAKRLAVAPGSGDGLVETAIRKGAQVLITGTIGLDENDAARERGLALITLGRLESERALVGAMKERLRDTCARNGWEIEVEGYRDRGGRWG